MKIRHWDEASQSWVVDGASNASNIELSNPSFLNESGESVTVDHGFTKVANKLDKIEKNLAWVYLNGAIAGTGGTGGTGGDSLYTINVAEGTTVYTTATTTDINVTINSGTNKKAFTLIAKNIGTNTVLGTWKIYSLTRTKITLLNLVGTIDIELIAYDSNNNYTSPTYVKAVAGAISLTKQSNPPKTIYLGGTAQIAVNYTLTNNIIGSAAGFVLTVNGIEVSNITGITTTIRSLFYDIGDIIFNSGKFVAVSGQKFIFSAYATTVLNGVTIKSTIDTFDITVADSQRLVIITNNISNFDPSLAVSQTYADLTSVEQNSRLVFPYYLSYALSAYNSFILKYDIYKVTSNGETLIEGSSGIIENILPNDINKSLSLSIPWEPNINLEYFKIKLSAYATSAIDDINAQDTTFVTFKTIESTVVELTANNDIQTLLAYYSNLSGFPNNPTGTWTYQLPTSGKFKYSGTFRPKFPNGVKLTLKDVNGVTSGFLAESAKSNEALNRVPGIVLEGESYGYLEVAQQMFPNVIISSGLSFFQSNGFNMSFTYKASESSDPSEVVMSIGRYKDDLLDSGIEISLEKIYVKIGSADTLVCKLPQNQLLTVDIDVSLSGTGWYFKVFINGVLSAVTRVLQSDIDWQFASNLYLGCRNVNDVKSRFSNVTFYDIKLYTSSQSDYSIVQNYISATEQASLIDGIVDQNLDTDLRLKNFFDSSGDCIIWDKNANNNRGGFLNGQQLYQTLVSRIDNTYPIVLIEETSSSPTLFQAYSTAIFAASEKGDIMNTTFPVKVTYTDKNGSVNIVTPTGVPSDKGVRVGLQGTSSLSYNAKNFELYCGDKNSAGDKLLFQPIDKWLPENEFTLKADVIDSSHVNNVVIGKIINGEVINSEGIAVKPLGATPPMALSNSVWDTVEKAEAIRSKFKHTSDGFPALIFIRYAPDINGNIKQPEFKGIYNFNLGRYAYYNLGLKILKDFTKDIEDGPSLVTNYVEAEQFWNTGIDNGVYSIEVNQNTSNQGAFQQDDLSIVKFMGDVTYTSRDSETAYNKVQKFYNQMANMALTNIPKYRMDDSGQTPRKLVDFGVNAEKWNSGINYSFGDYAYNNTFGVFKSIVNNHSEIIPNESISNSYWEYIGTITSFYTFDNRIFYNFAASDLHLNWENACGYFVLGMIFGMVDSMCKNLTLRNWGTDVWSTTFYDMDTAFGINNQGQDIVEYYAHLHRWQNINKSDTNLTSYEIVKNYQSDSEFKQYYASWWNRIWEVLENLGTYDSGAAGSRPTIENVYTNLRQNLFSDTDAFIDTYYKGYTDQTGSIIFNFDYNVKYLKVAQTYNINTNQYQDSTDFSQLKFLHGNRVMHVRDWFKKRIYFLDSIYGVTNNTVNIPTSIESPINSLWAANKATGSSSGSKFVAKLSAGSKILYRYAFDKTIGSFWIDEIPKDVIIPIPNGETIVYIYANDYITNFDYFKSYPWTGLTNINFPLLEHLDLSNLSNMPASDFLFGGVYNPVTNIGLRNIKSLNLSNIKLVGEGAAAYTLDVSNCNKLKYLNIANSSITKVTLSDSAVLKSYDLSGTAITSLVLKNQSFLEILNIDNCNSLTSIEIENCNKLTSINLPVNVTNVKITNCQLLTSINLPFITLNNSISALSKISIDNCPGLKTFNISGQNNPNLVVELVGAKNLEVLDLSGVASTNILLPSLLVNELPNFTSLKSLNISNTSISALKYNDNTSLKYLDLSAFPDLDNISAYGCKQLVEIKCKNDLNNPINLNSWSFSNCTSLTKIIGHYSINGSEVFKGCSSLKLNDDLIYETYGQTFITDPNATNISFNPTVSSLISCFEACPNISYNDFKYLMVRIGPMVTSIETMFKGCIRINGPIWYDIFRTCPNLLTIKEAFSNCKLYSTFSSRTNDYDPLNDQTWGILDFIPNIQDVEGAFENNLLEWIDDKVFQPIVYQGVTKYSSIVKVDRMFRGCSTLKTCVDTRAETIEPGVLNSETFFTNLRNLLALYPREVFGGCNFVDMLVVNDETNSYLFHTLTKSNNSIVLENSLYSGINLIGEIKVNVFGGITRTLVKGTSTYYIPKFVSIQSPFSLISNNSLTVKLSEMGQIFRNIGSTLLQAVGVFYRLKLDPTDSGIIPANMFKGCTLLNSIELLFSGLNLTNNGQIYKFPATYQDNGITKGMFDDCINLKSIKDLFKDCHNLKISLVGEGFKNCILENVSGAFAGSGVFGTIPYRLFFMSRLVNGVPTINQTIVNMDGVFKECWCIGYDSTREIDTTTILEENYTTQWSHHIVKVAGNKVSYKLDVSNLQKSFNYNKDNSEYIEYSLAYSKYPKYTYNNSTYTLYDTTNIVFYKYINNDYVVYNYDGYSTEEVFTKNLNVYTLYVAPPLFVKNPKYNPGDYAFDTWYLDGYAWDMAASSEPVLGDGTDLTDVKARLTEQYFTYDQDQAQVVLSQNQVERYTDCYQNYMIPTDFFRYCKSTASLSNILSDLNWFESILQDNDITGKKEVVQTSKVEGLTGRIPVKLFESLVGNTKLAGIFANTRFDAFVGLNGTTFKRGIMFPPDLFRYNTSVIDLSSIFNNIKIPVGVDINEDLFYGLPNLKIITSGFANCQFNKQKFNIATPNEDIFPQINFIKIFKYNTRIVDASALFAVYIGEKSVTRGLYFINDTLLTLSYNINNISNMFYGNVFMTGSVPEFKATMYPILTNVNNYLYSVPKNNITNANNLELRLKPSAWLTT